jgi:hypothetical protein
MAPRNVRDASTLADVSERHFIFSLPQTNSEIWYLNLVLGG